MSSNLLKYSRDKYVHHTEKDLVNWIEDMKNKRIPVNGRIIREEALTNFKFMRRKGQKKNEFIASQGH